MSSNCFSGGCGLCSSCSGDAGTKVVKYLSPRDLYKMETGKDPPPIPPGPKDTRALWQKMMYESSLYRIHLNSTWGRLFRGLLRRKKNVDMYKPDGIFWSIYKSHVEFLKGCTEEGVIYGEKRCLRPENSVIYSIVGSEIDINTLGGKVVISGGGLFDIDTLKKQMNLTNEDYEKYFDKFETYLVEVDEKMKEYGASRGKNFRGKVPESIKVGDEKYTLWEDDRIMCDEPDCSLMKHCMINWDEKDNYTGSHPPKHDSYYYGPIIASIPNYTKDKKHELCLTCALKASNPVRV